MPPFTFICPNTRYKVQGYIADEAWDDKPDAYEGILCAMCQQIHLVNPATGKVLGEDDE